jgi:hypothetical protein
MFSVIIYGRNDSHGYNLHKRAAISLNVIAELMTHPDDELLFVDYNTPDDHPTFPEAIHDTLTDKAKARSPSEQDPSGGSRAAVTQCRLAAVQSGQSLDTLYELRRSLRAEKR